MKKLLLAALLASFALASEYVLALQWFPSTCKVHNYKECSRPQQYWLSHLTLHGLWPKKQYCNVPARLKILDKKHAWKKMKITLSPDTLMLLGIYMPGVTSGLHNHEYIKHGSCFSSSPDYYYLTAIALTSQINQTPIRLFFWNNRGKRVQTKKIRHLFDSTYFKGAGKRVKFICKKGYLTELRIKLAGELSPKSELYDLLKNAKKTKIGCKIGKIAR